MKMEMTQNCFQHLEVSVVFFMRFMTTKLTKPATASSPWMIPITETMRWLHSLPDSHMYVHTTLHPKCAYFSTKYRLNIMMMKADISSTKLMQRTVPTKVNPTLHSCSMPFDRTSPKIMERPQMMMWKPKNTQYSNLLKFLVRRKQMRERKSSKTPRRKKTHVRSERWITLDSHLLPACLNLRVTTMPRAMALRATKAIVMDLDLGTLMADSILNNTGNNQNQTSTQCLVLSPSMIFFCCFRICSLFAKLACRLRNQISITRYSSSFSSCRRHSLLQWFTSFSRLLIFLASFAFSSSNSRMSSPLSPILFRPSEPLDMFDFLETLELRDMLDFLDLFDLNDLTDSRIELLSFAFFFYYAGFGSSVLFRFFGAPPTGSTFCFFAWIFAQISTSSSLSSSDERGCCFLCLEAEGGWVSLGLSGACLPLDSASSSRFLKMSGSSLSSLDDETSMFSILRSNSFSFFSMSEISELEYLESEVLGPRWLASSSLSMIWWASFSRSRLELLII